MVSARVLLLGGSGLLGAPAAHALREAGHEVTLVSRGQRGTIPGVRAVSAERGDARALAEALRGERFDLAVDLLAYGGRDVDQVLSLPSTRIGRYVLVSSGQVYLVACERRPPSSEPDGDLPSMPEPPGGTRDHANWVYGMGKREAEARLFERSPARGGHDLVLRLPVVHGAGDRTRRAWAYFERLLDGGPLLLPEGGRHPVRFVWSEDVARVLVSLAGGATPPGRVYNLAQPDEPTLREWIEQAAGCLGVQPVIADCGPEDLAAAGLDPQVSPFSGHWCSRPNPARAVSELGFRGTPSREWLPKVVAAHLAETPRVSHPGYADRARERELALRLLGI